MVKVEGEVSMMKKYWKILLSFFIMAIFIVFIFFHKPNSKSNITISDLHEKTGAECIEILEDYGLELSSVYQNDEKLAEESVKTIIDDIYKNGLQNDKIAYSYTEMNDLAKQIIRILQEKNVSSKEDDGTDKLYTQPVLKLDSDYTVGDFLYKDEKQYYIHENELVEYKHKPRAFSASTVMNGETKEFTFQWYEWNDEIKVLNETEIDTYFFEEIDGCKSHVLLSMRVPDTEFWTYKLCDLENNVIVPLFHDKLNEYSVDWIALSSDLTNATVSINKGEQRFVFDGEKISPIDEIEKENPYHDSYVWHAMLDAKVLVATEDGILRLLDFETGEKINEVETGLDLVYNDVSDNYNISRVKSDEGVYVAIYKLGEEILIYKMGE